ncbi:MAG: response regulator [Pseudomonadota bacterium]
MSKKLLIVDDETDIACFLKQFCSERGHEVSTANDGLEALLMVIVNEYDIMITNVKMPLIDGIELLQMVKEIKNGMKVIINSACHHREKEGLMYGAYAYIKKPSTLEQIEELLE